jgi:hypothetical protein
VGVLVGIGVTVGGRGVTVGGRGVTVGGRDVTVAWSVAVMGAVMISVADMVATGVRTGARVGYGVLVGNTFQASGVTSTPSKVGCGVRVGCAPACCLLANCVNAVLKMR